MINRNLLVITASAFLVFASCSNDNKTATFVNSGSSTQYIPVDSSSMAVADSAMTEEIAPYKAHVDSMMNVEIGFSPKEYFKKKPNGLLNNIAADMVLEMTRKSLGNTGYSPDFCLLNYGGLRHPLPKGVITISDVYQLMPFQNEVVILKLSGLQIDSLFEYIAATHGQPVAGCSVTVRNGHYISAKIGGKPFDKNRAYYLVTSDYLAKGGDRMKFLQNPQATYKTGMLLRNAMLEYIKEKTAEGKKIIASDEERIKILD